jgi:hypothetical protein
MLIVSLHLKRLHEAATGGPERGWLNTMPFHKTPAKSLAAGIFLWNDTARARFALLRSKKRLS